MRRIATKLSMGGRREHKQREEVFYSHSNLEGAVRIKVRVRSGNEHKPAPPLSLFSCQAPMRFDNVQRRNRTRDSDIPFTFSVDGPWGSPTQVRFLFVSSSVALQLSSLFYSPLAFSLSFLSLFHPFFFPSLTPFLTKNKRNFPATTLSSS